MARIIHPVHTSGRHYGHFGVVFDDGVAEVELTAESRAWYAGRGYGIGEVTVLEGELDGTGDSLPEAIEGGGEQIVPARRSPRK